MICFTSDLHLWQRGIISMQNRFLRMIRRYSGSWLGIIIL